MKNAYEVFEEFEKADSKEAKQAVLQKHMNPIMAEILVGTYHPEVKFTIDKWPYYKPDVISPAGMSYSTIGTEIRRRYIFEENNPRRPNISDEHKYRLLAQLLEGLEAREAIVYMNMLLKKPQAKGLTYKFLKETFPSLLP